MGKKRGREEEKAEDDTNGDAAAKATKARPSADVEELDVDDFLQSGLLVGDDDGEAEDGQEEGEDDEGDDPLILETDNLANGHDDSDVAEADGDDGDGEEGEEEQRLLAEIAEHEADMKALAKNDPAFYQHLQENDAELLSFSKEDVLAQRRDEQDDDAEGKAKAGKAQKKQQTGQLLTLRKALLHCVAVRCGVAWRGVLRDDRALIGPCC